jgi:glycosyltransferase involved in cell wall biosynthesis/tetratricopeptide (TPR) repeat protein
MSLESMADDAARTLADVKAAVAEKPRDAGLLNALGVAALQCAGPDALIDAANAFQKAWSADPRHVVAGLNLAETLVALGQRANAVEQVRRVLAMLGHLGGSGASCGEQALYRHGIDVLHAEWRRAAEIHAGDPHGESAVKLTLLRWRLYTLLGELTGDPVHHAAACLERPDLPTSRAALGVTLAKLGRYADALPHLDAGWRAASSDAATARALHDVLGRLGLTGRQMQVVPRRPGTSAPSARESGDRPLRIVWQGAQDAVHSLALVNRSFCAALLARGHELSLRPASGGQPPTARVELPAELAACVDKPLSGPADVHVTHQWPPDFTPPAEGRWVVIQPWEFGSMPRAWVAPMRDRVDEVWVPSAFVRDCYVRGGVPADKVRTVPNGAAQHFVEDRGATCGDRPKAVATSKTFKFLYVGGTLPRKGFDALLKVFPQVFTDRDDVCLIVKDMGVHSFYRGQTAEAQIERVRRHPHAPEIEYISDELSDDGMAALYQACDCVVQPYRGEGFCLPVAEAMANSKPVIVTGYGPALDYATDETAYLVPFRLTSLGEKRIGEWETVDMPFWAEPDLDFLRYYLRYVYEHPEEARERGARAREYVRRHLTWANAAAMAEERMAALVHRVPFTPDPSLPERPRETEVPLTPFPPHGRGEKQRVSLCMIVKNEAENLPACLGSIAGVFDEIIVVDTGSTDDTVAIAERMGAKVHHFAWIDHFAAARNESLKHATGDWVFWLDADDRLDADNRGKLQRLLAELPDERVAYVVKCLCLPTEDAGTATVVDHVRLFPNLPGLQWEHRLHEQILPALRRQGTATRWCDVVVQHVGYQDPALRQRKLARDLRILTLEYQEQPGHPFTLFNMGLTYRELGKLPEALDFFRQSLRGSAAADSIVRKLYASIASCERELGRPADALRTCREGRAHYPEDAELLLQESTTLDALGDHEGATHCLERLVRGHDDPHFASVATGLRGYLARHTLAQHYLQAGRLDEAQAQLQLALAEQPRFVAALYGLADVCVARRDAAGLDLLIGRLRELPGTLVEIEVLRAQLRQACGDHAAARAMLESLIMAYPRALRPRIMLSNVLLQEGRDWAAAERALRGVLEIDPRHAASRSNLDLLMRQQGRPASPSA